jgi:hypothetical protein
MSRSETSVPNSTPFVHGPQRSRPRTPSDEVRSVRPAEQQIAAGLGTVEKTVNRHRGRVMEQMRVTSLADLVRAVERLDGL